MAGCIAILGSVMPWGIHRSLYHLMVYHAMERQVPCQPGMESVFMPAQEATHARRHAPHRPQRQDVEDIGAGAHARSDYGFPFPARRKAGRAAAMRPAW